MKYLYLIRHAKSSWSDPSLSDFSRPLNHGVPRKKRAHTIELERDTHLYSIVRKHKIQVNSSHHQSVRVPGKGLKTAAKTLDGCIEAIEWKSRERFILGVQWHLERISGFPEQMKIMKALVRAART